MISYIGYSFLSSACTCVDSEEIYDDILTIIIICHDSTTIITTATNYYYFVAHQIARGRRAIRGKL